MNRSAIFRVLLGKTVRRMALRLDRVQRALLHDDPHTLRMARRERQMTRVLVMYDRIRSYDDIVPSDLDALERPRVPSVARIKQVERQAAVHHASDRLFAGLAAGASVEHALVDAVRGHVRMGDIRRARAVAQSLQARATTATVGDMAMAVVALADRVERTAWDLLTRHDLALVLSVAPVEFFRAAATCDPAQARDVLARALADEVAVVTDGQGWLDIARLAFVAGDEDAARGALTRAATDATDHDLVDRIAWLDGWFGRRAAAQAPVATPSGAVPFAVIDYAQPDESRSSRNLGDHVQTIAALGHVVRHRGLRFTGDPELADTARMLQARVPDEHARDDLAATLDLHRLHRDASSYSAVPDGTWALVFGWFAHSAFGVSYDLPLNPRVRPIFVSFHVNSPAALTADTVAHLRAHGPVGCRDWNTVHLLQSAGVPAFFSGCVTTTIDTVFAASPDPRRRRGTAWVDTRADGTRGAEFTQVFDEVRQRSFATNIADALDRLEAYRSDYRRVVTSRLHAYLPCRALGVDVEFRPKNPADVRFDGLIGIDDEAFARIRTTMTHRLEQVLRAIATGAGHEEVRALWTELCAADVAAARRRLDVPPITALIDVELACRTVHARSVTIERTHLAGTGPEIQLEMSLDGNLRRQLLVVLESIVARASRPLRVHILCRDHDLVDFRRVAALFPTVSFVWLPTDDVDHGDIAGMIDHITIATMDRLLLPDLLPHVDRIIHHDLDALCLADIAELADLDLEGHPLAARTSPQPEARSGFHTFVKAASRLRHDPAAARELIIRTHGRHEFDFGGFNAGIMVLDLTQMRSDAFCRDFLPYAARFGMNDQEVLNAYAGPRRAALPDDWNRFPRLEIFDRPKVLHWAGSQKPWGADAVAGRELWQEFDDRVSLRELEGDLAAARETSHPFAPAP